MVLGFAFVVPLVWRGYHVSSFWIASFSFVFLVETLPVYFLCCCLDQEILIPKVVSQLVSAHFLLILLILEVRKYFEWEMSLS